MAGVVAGALIDVAAWWARLNNNVILRGGTLDASDCAYSGYDGRLSGKGMTFPTDSSYLLA